MASHNSSWLAGDAPLLRGCLVMGWASISAEGRALNVSTGWWGMLIFRAFATQKMWISLEKPNCMTAKKWRVAHCLGQFEPQCLGGGSMCRNCSTVCIPHPFMRWARVQGMVKAVSLSLSDISWIPHPSRHHIGQEKGVLGLSSDELQAQPSERNRFSSFC